jgi:hypothetical protein
LFIFMCAIFSDCRIIVNYTENIPSYVFKLYWSNFGFPVTNNITMVLTVLYQLVEMS